MSILLVGKDKEFRLAFSAHLSKEGFEILQAGDGPAYLKALESRPIQLVLLDLDLPGSDGVGLVECARAQAPSAPILLLRNGTPRDVLEKAIAQGATEVVDTPIPLQELACRVKRRLSRPIDREAQDGAARSAPPGVWSPATAHVLGALRTVAPRNSTVLISGETGTGKEIAARAVHALSPRSLKPLVPVNCAALSPTVIESELFGHEKGAFTNATSMRKGRFELADGGTILLDEVAELSVDLQAKLLRVLQERSFERVGGNKAIKVDVRVIATTNRNLPKEVAEGRFREDLYYRLKVVSIEMPPLRSRVPEVRLFLEHFGALKGLSFTVAPEAMRCLESYAWPGNVREVENLVEVWLSTSLKDSTVSVDCLPREIREALEDGKNGRAGVSLKEALEEGEKKHITQVLKLADGNRRRAAELLGISRATLRNRMLKLGIPTQVKLAQAGWSIP